MTEEIRLDGRTLRAELGHGREEYHDLAESELHCLLWAATSEHQRRFGDRRTVHLLAYLSQSLPTMAREER